MKKLVLLSVILTLIVFNCTVPTGGSGISGSSGRITLSSAIPGEDTGALSRSINPADAARVIISIENSLTGEVVYDNYALTLYNLNGQFISESLELNLGDYTLTKYLVVDADNNVIFAAPVSPSALEELVSAPLPIVFSVFDNVTTSVNVEVLPTENSTAQDFGYAIYTFDVVYADLVFPTETIIKNYNAGEDGIPGTDDDVISSLTVQRYKNYYADNWQRYFTSSGSDGTWGTADDQANGWFWSRFDNGGSMQSGPGADGIWFTTDDNISGWSDWTDPNIERTYNDPGADGIWFTADDVMSGYYSKVYNEDGEEIMRKYYGDPGLDGIWETSDDQLGDSWLGAYVTWEYEGRFNRWNSWTKQVIYDDPGADGIWFTDDDDVRSFSTHEFADGTKFFTRENVYNDAGADGIMFTDDDELVSYKTAENTY